MKKWISYMLLSSLLVTALPAPQARAEEAGCTGKLAANGNNINISLSFPQAASEKITSLHFRVNVSITSGEMKEPGFQFKDSIKSDVKSSEITKNSNGYIVDVVLSGKKENVIFPENGQAEIGTLSLNPSGSTYTILTGFAGLNDSYTFPSAEYVTAFGQYTQEVKLLNTNVIETKKSGQQNPPISSSLYGPGAGAVTTKEPDATAQPSATDVPSATASPSATDSPSATNTPGTETSPLPSVSGTPSATGMPEVTDTPDGSFVPEEDGIFNTEQKPSLSASVNKGTRVVKLKWKTINGADGYIIYSAKDSGKYKKLKTIANPDKTSCNVKMAYASSYSFRIRAFKNSEDGSIISGKYSKTKKVTTAPARIKGVKAKISGNMVNLSWKKVKNAKGYQVFASNRKNGSYTRIKIIRKGSVIKTAVKKNKKNSYFKVRAYVNSTDNKHVYGNFCTAVKAK